MAVFCLIPQMVLAQNVSVQGTVTDENGETMIGVSTGLFLHWVPDPGKGSDREHNEGDDGPGQ